MRSRLTRETGARPQRHRVGRSAVRPRVPAVMVGGFGLQHLRRDHAAFWMTNPARSSPMAGEMMGLVVPVTTASDSVESGDRVRSRRPLSWGPKVQDLRRGARISRPLRWRRGQNGREFLRAHAEAAEGSPLPGSPRSRNSAVADIGRVVFQRIDRLVSSAQEMLRSTSLTRSGLHPRRAQGAVRGRLGGQDDGLGAADRRLVRPLIPSTPGR